MGYRVCAQVRNACIFLMKKQVIAARELCDSSKVLNVRGGYLESLTSSERMRLRK